MIFNIYIGGALACAIWLMGDDAWRKAGGEKGQKLQHVAATALAMAAWPLILAQSLIAAICEIFRRDEK